MALLNFISQLKAEARIGAWVSEADPHYSKQLQRERETREHNVLRVGTWAAVFIYLSFISLDLLLLPDVADSLVMVRLTIGVSFLLLVEYGRWIGLALGRLQLLAALAIAAAAIGWLSAAIQTENHDILSSFVIFGTTFLLCANLFFNFRFWLCAVSTVPVTAVFVCAIMFWFDIGIEDRLLLSLFFVCCLVLSLILSWRLSMERYYSFLNSAEAKIQKKIVDNKSEQLSILANTDPLTGLYNRRFMANAFKELVSTASQRSRLVGVVLIDADYFKRFNDAYGHKVGDDCLVSLSNVFERNAKRFGGVIGRHGGEEFIGFFNVETEDHLLQIINTICANVEALKISHENRNDHHEMVTVSVGASVGRAADASLDRMTQEADHALFYSKFLGRACATLYDPEIHEKTGDGQMLNKAIRQAIKKDRISVEYQPIYQSNTQTLYGYEALMRMKDEEGKSVSPGLFIPAAEQTGDITGLGLWILSRVCEDILDEKLKGVVSVNTSAVQLRNPNFSIQVAAILGRTGVSPSRISLEVTEGQEIFDCASSRENLRNLRLLGVGIWLDDFGTGYAGLSWLDEFKFDVVKIDQSFLKNSSSEEGKRFLTDIVEMLKNKKTEVLCEGVEVQEHVELLNVLDVNLLQGYYLGRPMPIDQISSKEKEASFA